ncbi:MAG: tRNA (adenosine(37)-N6)-threonylcarbamoyltransferase complex ATPase subunit type 1 TsaE, partial [Bryobacteraceae bacterium]
AEETIALGRKIAARLHGPMLVLLKGDLGAGKTTLAKGIISGLGAAREEDVTSPTFTLVHAFSNSERTGEKVYHVDLYRVEGTQELESLALEDILSEPCIAIVEWSERLTLRTAWPLVHVELQHGGGEQRRIRISGLPGQEDGSQV